MIPDSKTECSLPTPGPSGPWLEDFLIVLLKIIKNEFLPGKNDKIYSITKKFLPRLDSNLQPSVLEVSAHSGLYSHFCITSAFIFFFLIIFVTRIALKVKTREAHSPQVRRHRRIILYP